MMANVEDLLRKQKDRIAKINDAPIPRKKISRTGPTRPWQENLPQYQPTASTPTAAPPSSDGLENTIASPKPLAMREQTVSNASPKPLAMREQIVSGEISKKGDASDSVSNAYAEALAEPLAMREQTVSNACANESFEALVGKEKKLLFFVFSKCQNLGALETALITTEELRQLLEISSERLRNVIYRLSQKGYLEVTAVKNGRSGWRKFQLRRELFQKLCFQPSVSNALAMREQTVSIASPKAYAEALAGSSSSSSLIEIDQNFKTTTSEPELPLDAMDRLHPDWAAVDISPLSEIGFMQSHFNQLAKVGKFSAAEVQDFIHFFAFDLKFNGKGRKIKGPPVNFFMGILQKGMPYAPPDNYESPADEARRKFLEGKRRLEERRLAEEQELRALAFAEWRRGLTDGQAMDLVPDAVKDIPRAREASVRNHFDEQVYPGLEAVRSDEEAAERAMIRAAIAQSLEGISK